MYNNLYWTQICPVVFVAGTGAEAETGTGAGSRRVGVALSIQAGCAGGDMTKRIILSIGLVLYEYFIVMNELETVLFFTRNLGRGIKDL